MNIENFKVESKDLERILLRREGQDPEVDNLANMKTFLDDRVSAYVWLSSSRDIYCRDDNTKLAPEKPHEMGAIVEVSRGSIPFVVMFIFYVETADGYAMQIFQSDALYFSASEILSTSTKFVEIRSLAADFRKHPRSDSLQHVLDSAHWTLARVGDISPTDVTVRQMKSKFLNVLSKDARGQLPRMKGLDTNNPSYLIFLKLVAYGTRTAPRSDLMTGTSDAQTYGLRALEQHQDVCEHIDAEGDKPNVKLIPRSLEMTAKELAGFTLPDDPDPNAVIVNPCNFFKCREK